MMMRRSWRVLWKKTKINPPSRCERWERESGVIHQIHIRGTTIVQRLAWRATAGLTFITAFLVRRKRSGSIYTACGRSRKETIDYCHFSEAYGSSKVELERCSDLDIILFISLVEPWTLTRFFRFDRVFGPLIIGSCRYSKG